MLLIFYFFIFASLCVNAVSLTSLEKSAHDALAIIANDYSTTKKSPKQRKIPLLCVVFINGTKLHDPTNPANSRHTAYSKHIQYNMLVMRKFCEFAVLSYSCATGSHNVVIEIAKYANATLSLYRCVKPVNETNLHVRLFYEVVIISLFFAVFFFSISVT